MISSAVNRPLSSDYQSTITNIDSMHNPIPIYGLLVLIFFSANSPVHASSPEMVIPLLGSNPCTWGPSFWCASEENMKRCGVTAEECEKYASDVY
ncbi:hypothetical protein FVEN_g4604 [Fusarium venenatum]|nr:hypothetical protein FVEN_g4604 [Fusarium venenatum]KAH7004405.1 hypothetical protein EDB82DRAFT_486701 [Fusarium venenatum]